MKKAEVKKGKKKKSSVRRNTNLGRSRSSSQAVLPPDSDGFSFKL